MIILKQNMENTKFIQTKPYSILVTGATGFIGSKLVEKLSQKGYSVKGMSRQKIQDKSRVKFVKADVFNPGELQTCLEGVEIAFYLLHSMEGDKKNWKEFASREKTQAKNFLKAATNAGVKRIIYLGGLVNQSLDLSPHMKSRKEVGEILSSGSIPVTQLQASLIIGAQGGSYAMLRYLVERLRVMVCPSWVKSLAQPIALDDVIGSGISVTGIAMNRTGDGALLSLNGIAGTRENLLAFVGRLQEHVAFSQVTLPVSQLVFEEDINFSLQIVFTKQ